MQWFLKRLPERFRWAPHNLVSHPISEIVFWFTGNAELSGRIHDWTIPLDVEPGKGRG